MKIIYIPPVVKRYAASVYVYIYKLYTPLTFSLLMTYVYVVPHR